MICDRCEQLMRADEAEQIYIDAASGAGVTVNVHRVLCARPRTLPRSYPQRPGR
ncbi:hypothetical protein [Streptomyces sp. NPDC002932]|uniref:hypothetical protein n=1 Tax=Streptomyces sp. NPDC002932 TaxID=3364672 RepID=UPI0036A8D65D